MNEIRREVLGGIAAGAVLAGSGWLIPRILGDTLAACEALPGRLAQAGDTGTSARCHAVDIAFQFRPFLVWLGLIILGLGLVVALLTQVSGDPDTSDGDPPAGHDTDPAVPAPRTAPAGDTAPLAGWSAPATAESAHALARDAVHLLAAGARGGAAPPRAVREQVDNLLDRQLHDVEMADFLDTFWTDPTDHVNRRALIEAVARCAEDDPDFFQQLRTYVADH